MTFAPYDGGFTAKGHGYTDPRYLSPGRTVCTAFDGWDVIATPLGGNSTADRERRVYKRGDGPGVTYASHVIALAETDKGQALAILMENGSGREVLALGRGPDMDAMRAAFLAMDESTLYAVLYSIWRTASTTRDAAAAKTQTLWAQAHIDGRIRKRRSAGRIRVHVETEFERDLRLGKVRPSSISIDLATGEASDATAGAA